MIARSLDDWTDAPTPTVPPAVPCAPLPVFRTLEGVPDDIPPTMVRLTEAQATPFVLAHHYSGCMPSSTVHAYAMTSWRGIETLATVGYGKLPRHTIEYLFPGVGVEEYVELGRMCARDDSYVRESHFLSVLIRRVRADLPGRKLLYSCADGMVGKPGIIYQAANFLYGGSFRSVRWERDGKWHHAVTLFETEGTNVTEELVAKGYTPVRGVQFRYVYFLCGKGEAKRLLRASPIRWGREYPTKADCAGGAEQVSRVRRPVSNGEGSVQLRGSALPAPVTEDAGLDAWTTGRE